MELNRDYPVKRLIEISKLESDTVFTGYDELCIRTYTGLGYFVNFRNPVPWSGEESEKPMHVLNKEGLKALDLMILKQARKEYFDMVSQMMDKYHYRSDKDMWNDTVSTETLIHNEFSREVERWNKEHGKEEEIRLI